MKSLKWKKVEMWPSGQVINDVARVEAIEVSKSRNVTSIDERM
jgi:hypothetical protein